MRSSRRLTVSMSSEFLQACTALTIAARERQDRRVVSGLSRLAGKLEALPSGGIGKAPKAIEQVAEEIRHSLVNGIALTQRQVRQSAWCLWNQTTRLAEDAGLRGVLLEQIAAAPRAGAFRALAANFLEGFKRDEAGIADAATTLSALADRWPGNWAQLQAQYQIFDLKQGPKRLAEAVVAQDRAPHLILQDFGVALTSAQGNYVRAVTGALLEHLANGGEPDHERRLDKVQRYALTERGTAIFGDMLRQIAEAILLPFKGVKPGKLLLDKVLALLVKALGDPRLKPGNWLHIPENLTKMVRGWLAEQSLRQFLDVVNETTDEPEHWRYRRAFWEAVYDMGLVSEAWVAFGSKGAKLVRDKFGKEASFGVVEQVRSTDKKVDPGHAVLFLRIGSSLVTDWSHMGRCNIWSDYGAEDAPDLYERRYRSNDVQIAGTGNTILEDKLAVMHSSPAHYSWQRTVAERLRQLTGRRIQQSDYAVHR